MFTVYWQYVDMIRGGGKGRDTVGQCCWLKPIYYKELIVHNFATNFQRKVTISSHDNVCVYDSTI